MLEDTMPISHSFTATLMPETPRAASVPTTLPSKKYTGDDTGALPKNVLYLQGEMNRIMGQLLMTRASMDAHQRKVFDCQMAFHQKEAQTTVAIKEAEAVHAAAVREVKACCTNIIQDAEATCATTIRKAEMPAQNVPTLCSKLTGTVWRA